MAVTRYVLTEKTLVLDTERRYVLKIRDLPPDEKPRERLLQHGPAALSVAELLAVVLSTGTKKEEVMTMAHRIMREYGEGNIMSQKNPATLSAHLDIPLGKALQIVAVSELGRRFFLKNESGSPTLRTAREVFEYAIDMRTLVKEHLRGVYLNAHYKVIHDEVISIGTLDSNAVHPRDVFKPALEYAAAAVILIHNHPSGVVEASVADLSVTEQLIKAGSMLGIDLIDHIIVTRDSFKSIPVSYR